MATTSFSTSNALTKKAWELKLFREAQKESYFSKFMGESSDSLVYVKTQLEKDYGDKITFGIRMRLTGAGVTSGTTLEGNEEALTTYDHSITLEQYRHGVRDNGAMTRQRAMFSISKESEDALKDWGAEKIDTLCFSALEATPTQVAYKTNSTTFLYTTTAATASGALVAADSKLTLNFISFLKTLAKTGHNRAFNPIRPVKVGGRAYYILLVHPDVMFDLRIDSGFQQAFREAEVRGPENPLFKGATAIWDGVVIHEHETVSIATNAGAGSNVPWSKCTLMGAQALCWAWGQRPEVVQETFDYGDQVGHAWGMISATNKPKFNSIDYGSLGVYVSRTQVSDA